MEVCKENGFKMSVVDVSYDDRKSSKIYFDLLIDIFLYQNDKE